tara:strand:+ start:929 stop:1078 length:150 start_codon:yes stop_codon:yes gene_type:complete
MDIDKIVVTSDKEQQDYTLKQLLERIEDLEDKQRDIKYFLANPSKFNDY